jgi:hypothetical protein
MCARQFPRHRQGTGYELATADGAQPLKTTACTFAAPCALRLTSPPRATYLITLSFLPFCVTLMQDESVAFSGTEKALVVAN